MTSTSYLSVLAKKGRDWRKTQCPWQSYRARLFNGSSFQLCPRELALPVAQGKAGCHSSKNLGFWHFVDVWFFLLLHFLSFNFLIYNVQVIIGPPHRIVAVVLVAQLCPTFCDPMDYSLPGSSVRGILQARILEWVAIPYSRGSSRPRDQTWVSGIAGKIFTVWATREGPWFFKVVKCKNIYKALGANTQ